MRAGFVAPGAVARVFVRLGGVVASPNHVSCIASGSGTFPNLTSRFRLLFVTSLVGAMPEPLASDVANRSSDRSDMQGAGKSAVSNGQMQLLLVGKNKDFSYLRDLLSQSGNGDLGLDYAHSTEDALARLSKTNYDLLICEYRARP